MKNKKIMYKLTHGMYVLTTDNGGCMVDAVMQASSEKEPMIAISVMKSNYTNELMKKNNEFAISILDLDVNPEIIKTFGFNSMRDIDKFEKIDFIVENNLKIIKDSIGYLICKKVDTIETETHTLFLAKVIDGDVFKDLKPMSYNYYQEHKDNLLKLTTEKGKTAWICTICGYIYYGDELPENYVCPMCGAPRELFKKM